MSKKFIVVTGGAGFVGSNLIEYLVNKTNYSINTFPLCFISLPSFT